MKKRVIISLLILPVLFLTIFALKSKDFEGELTRNSNVKEDTSDSPSSFSKNTINNGIDQSVIKTKKRMQKKENIDETSELSAAEFYNDFFSIAGLENGFLNNITQGEGINVNNFYDKTRNPSYFVPLYSDSKVVAVAIYREFTHSEKGLATMSKMNTTWFSYPPVSINEAEPELISKYPNTSFQKESGYYYLDDGEIPYYLFTNVDGNENKYYFVSSYDKKIIVKDRASQQSNIEDDAPPVKMSNDGYMEINTELTSGLSKEELVSLRKDIDLTNDYIQKGLMKFDKKMNVIFDKRPAQNSIQAIPFEDQNHNYEKNNDTGHVDGKIKEETILE